MKTTQPLFEKYILVCENKRPEGACCSHKGERIRQLLKNRVLKEGLAGKIRVSRTGCLDVCKYGPNILLMPDHVWYQDVQENDVDDIFKNAKRSLSNER